MNNPFSQPKTEWLKLRDAIQNDELFALMLTNGNGNSDTETAHIESCGYKSGNILTFIRQPLGRYGVTLSVAIGLDVDREAILEAFNSLFQNQEIDEYWK